MDVDSSVELCNQQCNELLNLSYRGLFVMPMTVSSLKHLRRLLLSNNKLSSPPSEVSGLVQLEELALDNNCITMLPSDIGCLSELRYLSISNNPISLLPDGIGCLHRLKEFWASECHLMFLPSSLGQLNNLEKLCLRGNQLETIPDDLKHLVQLRWLNLSNNRLRRLPNCFALPKLVTFSACDNQLDSLPPFLVECPSLSSVLLSGNRISDLADNDLVSLSDLEKLDLRDNPLTPSPHWKGLNHILFGFTGIRAMRVSSQSTTEDEGFATESPEVQ